MKSDFSLISETKSNSNEIIGGQVAATGQGCGNIFSGESLFFNKVRHLTFECSCNIDISEMKHLIIECIYNVICETKHLIIE